MIRENCMQLILKLTGNSLRGNLKEKDIVMLSYKELDN